jgi:glucosyl-dolichyl phosphate glucuronosyltransferase
VIIVNYNRPLEVKDAVKSLVNQSIAPFEILIIDDASKSPLDMKEDSSKIKLVRFDKEIGLSNARNHGIGIATGEYLAFIDDDCIVSRNWIKEIQKGIIAGGEVLGGPLKPMFKAKPPKWWNERELGYFVGVGNSEKQEIWGANMVFRKEVFNKIGVFDPNLGRQKGKLLAFEDTKMISKARESYKVLFLPDAWVFHLVNVKRLNLRYIIRWSYNHGKSERLELEHNKVALMRVSGGAFYFFLEAVMKFLDPFSKSTKSVKILQVSSMARSIGLII